MQENACPELIRGLYFMTAYDIIKLGTAYERYEVFKIQITE